MPLVVTPKWQWCRFRVRDRELFGCPLQATQTALLVSHFYLP
jgi:hypothetical protein